MILLVLAPFLFLSTCGMILSSPSTLTCMISTVFLVFALSSSLSVLQALRLRRLSLLTSLLLPLTVMVLLSGAMERCLLRLSSSVG